MSKKKSFIVMIAFVLIAVTLTACGGGIDADASGQTVVFWHAMSSGANLEGLTAVVDEFNATNEWGITVEAISQGRQSELETAFNGAVTTGELPNLAQGFANGLVKWHSLDAIMGLNDFIGDREYGLSDDEIDAIFAGPYSSGTLADGTQIGIPMNQSAQVMFYNHTWAQELGFANPPATSAELKEQACAASAANDADDNPDNDGTGGYVMFPSASTLAPWIWAFGGEFVNEAGDGYDFTNQAVIDAMVFQNDLVQSGCTLTTPSFPNPEFAARQALFAVSSSAGIPFQGFDMADAENDDVWGAIPFPGPDGTLVVNGFGQMVGIVPTNPEADLAAWLFLRYLTSPETQATWIEFTSYFPTQSTTDVSAKADDVVWNDAWSLLPLAKGEPNLAAHGSVRGEMQDAGFAIMDATTLEEIIAILEELNEKAAELVAESQ